MSNKTAWNEISRTSTRGDPLRTERWNRSKQTMTAKGESGRWPGAFQSFDSLPILWGISALRHRVPVSFMSDMPSHLPIPYGSHVAWAFLTAGDMCQLGTDGGNGWRLGYVCNSKSIRQRNGLGSTSAARRMQKQVCGWNPRSGICPLLYHLPQILSVRI